MFVALDECTEWERKIIGAISISVTEAEKFENECFKLRFDHMIFGEIKWDKLKREGHYFDFYKKFLETFFKYKTSRFHSNSFKRNQHTAAYALARSIIWKLQRIGFNGSISFLFDSNGDKGREESIKTRELFNKDSTIKIKIRMCNQGNSTIINLLQVADLICGAVAYKLAVNNNEILSPNKAKMELIEFLESLDNNLDITASLNSKMWGYYEKKIQNYNLV